MPKVWYFNDLRHWYIYALEPPLSPVRRAGELCDLPDCNAHCRKGTLALPAYWHCLTAAC